MPSEKNKTDYANAYRDIDFRLHPEKYVVGIGEQGVLIAEPYKGEILPHWKFATPKIARVSATTIFAMFESYKNAGDFVGMDMARKFLQMGFTRSRRYANHANGRKYGADRTVIDQESGSEESEKAESARIFYEFYTRARQDKEYLKRLAEHKQMTKKA